MCLERDTGGTVLTQPILHSNTMTYTTHEQATRLKALGFDKPVRDYYWTSGMKGMNFTAKNYNKYPDTVSIPKPSEVLDWFREEKRLHGWVRVQFDSSLLEMQVLSTSYVGYYTRGLELFGRTDNYPTHPQATSALIDKLIEILEEQKT